jgi:hypothetical protein
MQAITIPQIEEQLRQLHPDKLAVVLDFVSYLVERQHKAEAKRATLTAEALSMRDRQGQAEDNEETALAESGMSDYLANLQDYEERLARGEIQW